MKRIVIFGATGAIGTELAILLSKEAAEYGECEIRAVTRDVNKSCRLSELKLKNVTLVQGDPLDAESVSSLLCQDDNNCDLVFCCVGLHRYEAKYWARQWPIIVDNLLAAIATTTTSSATTATPKPKKLVFCDNIYAHGAGHDKPITTATPTVAADYTKGKPQIRAALRKRFQQHMENHPGTLAVVGGADFFGPHVTNTSFLGDTLTGKLVQGQTALAVGSVQPVHDFCYAPDFAKALATVAFAAAATTTTSTSSSFDKFWICPHTIHNKSLQQIANDIAQKVETAKQQQQPSEGTTATTTTTTSEKKKTKDVSFSVLNVYLLYLLSPFMTFAYEMIECFPFGPRIIAWMILNSYRPLVRPRPTMMRPCKPWSTFTS